ncbi:MAG: hypothetical protein ACXW6R_15655 [Candidatus Binatia bacterium]
MAKQLVQTINLIDGNETSLPYVEKGVQPWLPERILFLIKTLAVYLRGRRRRETVESFIPRQSHERESRLEFARFIHW